jgi:hypothetical protein
MVEIVECNSCLRIITEYVFYRKLKLISLNKHIAIKHIIYQLTNFYNYSSLYN